MIFQLVKQNNKLMSMWKEQSNSISKPQSSRAKAEKTPPPPPTPTPTERESTPPPPPPKPTYYEPEEFSAESMVENMTGMKENSNFKDQPQADGMPNFGDPSLLSDMEKLAKKEKVIDITPTNDSSSKRKRGRPKKSN